MTPHRFVRPLLAAALASAVLTPIAHADDLVARGSDSTIHIVKDLAAAFAAETGHQIKVEGGGSGKGAAAALAGEVPLAFMSREATADEKAGGLVTTPYALDGIAVIVNPQNPVEDLSVDQLKAIFTGDTTTWPDGKPVMPFNRNEDSGTRKAFQELVLKDAKFSDKAAVKHDGILVDSVSKVPSSVAFTSVAEATSSVKTVSVNHVKPTPQTVKDKSYPLSRTLVLATKGAPSADAKAFIDFAIGPKGQAVVAKANAVPVSK